jgi:selenocysteine lyase/cysteine desulfurase
LGPQRQLFDIPPGVAYLNCAYMAPQLRSVTEAGLSAVQRKASPWTVPPSAFFDESERLRSTFASVAGVDADAIALVPSVSYGIGTAVANVDIAAGQTVVVLAEQFPSNVYPWRAAAAASGAEVLTVARPADGDWTAAVATAVDERTAVVAVPQCHWTDGSIVDLVAVGAAAREVGAALVVDATQSFGAVPFDVAAVQPDFLVTAGYKWLLGPYSLGYLYVAPHRRDGVPLEHNWITRAGSEDFAALVDYRDEPAPGARRYDVGERSNFVLVPMALAALEQILAWGRTVDSGDARRRDGGYRFGCRRPGPPLRVGRTARAAPARPAAPGRRTGGPGCPARRAADLRQHPRRLHPRVTAPLQHQRRRVAPPVRPRLTARPDGHHLVMSGTSRRRAALSSPDRQPGRAAGVQRIPASAAGCPAARSPARLARPRSSIHVAASRCSSPSTSNQTSYAGQPPSM